MFPAIQQPTDIATEAAVPGPPGDSEYVGEEIIVPDSPPEASAVLRQRSRFVSLSAPIGDTGVRSLAVNILAEYLPSTTEPALQVLLIKLKHYFASANQVTPGLVSVSQQYILSP